MEGTNYLGWRNHATWAVNLHLLDTVTAWIRDDIDEWGTQPDDIDTAAELFETLLCEMVEECELLKFPLLADLLDDGDIDFYSLGEHALTAAGVDVEAIKALSA